jgi:hypothetical protein
MGFLHVIGQRRRISGDLQNVKEKQEYEWGAEHEQEHEHEGEHEHERK